MKSSVSVLLVVSLLFVPTYGFCEATYDVVYLKNGSIIKGIIEENIINEKIALRMPNGNFLVFKYDNIKKIERLPGQNGETPIASTNTTLTANNYYQRGIILAQDEYKCHTTTGGVLSGFSLGLIGWGIGYIIVANQDVRVPKEYTSNLGTVERHMLSIGYKERASKIRKSNFNTGAAIGTLSLLVLAMMAN